MPDHPTELEALWDNLLSRQTQQIIWAYTNLSLGEKQSVLIHLKRMTAEDGWHPEQAISAQIALDALQNLTTDELDKPSTPDTLPADP